MITKKQYESYPETFWIGKKVKTLKKLQNGWFEIPVGTILVINRKYKGFDLQGLEICPHCNIGKKISISRVQVNDVQLLGEQEQ